MRSTIPLDELVDVPSWGEHLGVHKGFRHLARPGAPRTLCGREYPPGATTDVKVGICGTCKWIQLGSPMSQDEWFAAVPELEEIMNRDLGLGPVQRP